MPKTFLTDFTGKRFNRLTVVKFLPDTSKYGKWLCRCDCGTEKAIFMQSFVRGITKSCGCYQSDYMASKAIHGHARRESSKSRTYASWSSMMDRCHWGGHKIMFAKYGAKGIFVHPAWHDFRNFLTDMGERPQNTSIDRIDNAKGYYPGNCRWATRHEQALNTKRTVKVVLDGKVQIVFNICENLGLSKQAVRSRAVRRKNDYVAALQSMGIDARPLP